MIGNGGFKGRSLVDIFLSVSLCSLGFSMHTIRKSVYTIHIRSVSYS